MQMRSPFLFTLLVSLAGGTLIAQEATVKTLRSTGLAGDCLLYTSPSPRD